MEQIFKRKEIQLCPRHNRGTLLDCDKAKRGNLTVLRWNVELNGWTKYQVNIGEKTVYETDDVEKMREFVTKHLQTK